MRLYQVLSLRTRVDLGAMAMKGYSTFPKSYKAGASPLDDLISYPRHSLSFFFPLQRCSRCILQSQSTGLVQDEMSVLCLKALEISYYLSDIKRVIHSSHVSIDRCIHCLSVFSGQGMSSDIREYISTSETSCMFTTEQAKETLMRHDFLERPPHKKN